MPYALTTPLYYVNDKPHIGSAYTTMAVDALARWKRLQGEQVVFITGCDEHGQKIHRSALAAAVEPQAYVDAVATSFSRLWQRAGISHDRFIRTTDPRHRAIVQAFYQRVRDNGFIHSGRQQGWYCVACEEYKDIDAAVAADSASDGGRAAPPSCSIHQRQLEWRDEENLFFRLSLFQERIAALVHRPGFIAPQSRQREIQNFVAGGLRDFSISRVDLPWGIDVPDQPGHTFYVWFDALLGYVTALLDPAEPANLTRAIAAGWPAQLHVIGKDILRFHAVYWPAMLMAADLPVPAKVFGHGFLTREGQKMGKTLGNTLDPAALFERVGVEPVRWYLLRDISFGDDGDFQQQRFLDLVNNDLANTIGNLLNRSISMTRRWFDSALPADPGCAADPSHPLAIAAAKATAEATAAYEAQDLKRAAETALALATAANAYLNAQAPWTAIKHGELRQQVQADLYAVLDCCRIVGLLLNPLVPNFADRLLAQLGVAPLESERSAKAGSWLEQSRWGGLVAGAPLPEPELLLARIELDGSL